MKRMESAFFVDENELLLSLAWKLSQVVTQILTQRRRERRGFDNGVFNIAHFTAEDSSMKLANTSSRATPGI